MGVLVLRYAFASLGSHDKWLVRLREIHSALAPSSPPETSMCRKPHTLQSQDAVPLILSFPSRLSNLSPK